MVKYIQETPMNSLALYNLKIVCDYVQECSYYTLLLAVKILEAYKMEIMPLKNNVSTRSYK